VIEVIAYILYYFVIFYLFHDLRLSPISQHSVSSEITSLIYYYYLFAYGLYHSLEWYTHIARYLKEFMILPSQNDNRPNNKHRPISSSVSVCVIILQDYWLHY